jgi:bacillopeptidase F
LKTNSEDFKDIQQYWIVNMISLKAKSKAIETLKQQKGILEIQADEEFIAGYINPIKTNIAATKSPGTSEIGLRVVNAHKLWAMGYTGRGRISYTMDTGIWPEHSVFGGRFLANYYPLSRAWLGFDSDFPRDKSGSHGTHVTGTILGLDTATKDTIGMAFNSYFMVSDPIVTNLADIKPYSDFAIAFQWALNPDGDTNTTHDIPDVINNSWGRGPAKDTNLCHSPVTQMLSIIESAGIANVFSAGNSGPLDSTISEPHHINVGLLNTFTVGSINPHDTNYQISSFSSRGPSICPASGSYAIKPEVVAPGFQIRSSVENNGFAVYNGTSMASPHVSGAVLLLKEAFPFLTGEQILMALYMSTKDLGIAGEDNTYGTGLIDVFAAYNYLAQNHNPVLPNISKYDISIIDIIGQNKLFYCDTTIDVKIIVKNLSDSTFQNFTLEYQVDNHQMHYYSYNNSLASNQTDTISINNISTFGEGDKELFFKINPGQNITELDSINNRRAFRFNVRRSQNLPFVEDFEYSSLKQKNWFIINPDNSNTWDTISTVNKNWGSKSAFMDCFNYMPKSNQKDEIISAKLDIGNSTSLKMKFDYAYSQRFTIFYDTLNIYLIDSCDNNKRTLIWAKGGQELSTFDTTAHQFIPYSKDHWETAQIDLTQFVNSQEIMIVFQSVNKAGNGIYIDNIKIYDGNNEPQSVSDNNNPIIKLFPNPASNHLFVDYNQFKKQDAEYRIVNVTGGIISSGIIKNAKDIIEINTTNFPSGIFFFILQNENGRFIEKFVKK